MLSFSAFVFPMGFVVPHKVFFLAADLQVSQHDIVENLMISPEVIRPLSVDVEVREVVMRFFESDGIPVVNERGSCVGVVYAADCKEV